MKETTKLLFSVLINRVYVQRYSFRILCLYVKICLRVGIFILVGSLENKIHGVIVWQRKVLRVNWFSFGFQRIGLALV